MSATAIWTVHCYGYGNGDRSEDCHWWLGEEHTQAEAQAMARAHGWTVKPGNNICPACRKTLK